MTEITKENAEQLIADIVELQRKSKEIESAIEDKKVSLKVFMKSNALEKFGTERGDLATLSQQTRQTFDKDATLRLLGEVQFKECVKFRETPFEVLKIVSKESKDKMPKVFKEGAQ